MFIIRTNHFWVNAVPTQVVSGECVPHNLCVIGAYCMHTMRHVNKQPPEVSPRDCCAAVSTTSAYIQRTGGIAC